MGSIGKRAALPGLMAAGLFAMALAACTTDGAATGANQQSASAIVEAGDAGASDDPDNWAAFGRTAGEQHFSPLTEINTGNIGQLGLAWSFDLPNQNSVSAPLAVDGKLFVVSGYSELKALDAVTGKLLWEYDPKVKEVAGRKLRQGWGSRGIAYGEGMVYTGTHDGRLIAVDAATGAEVWSARTLPLGNAAFISGPPRYFDGKVIIGFGGADVDDLRGYVTTYDARTGEQLWRFYTVPGNPADGFEDAAQEMAAKTWFGEWWKLGGGGTVWNSMTFDEANNLMILGVGNGGPWNHKIRSQGKGDNLFLASIVALDADTGAYKWHYQVNPGETWDYNASMDMELAELVIDGEVRQVLMTAPKNGFFYVIDRKTGKLISAEPFVTVTWATGIDKETGRPIEVPASRYPDGQSFVMWPGPVGAHTWLPMAYSPETRLVYIPVIEMATKYNDVGIEKKNWKRVPGHAVDGGANPDFVVAEAGPTNGTSFLLAWDPVRQQEVWRVPTPGVWNGGVMATGGDLVFQGRIDGTFDAYDASTGAKVWSFAAQAPVTAPPISYRAGGKQYITVQTGMGTSGAAFGPLLPVDIGYRTQARRVLTFALGGEKTLPPSPPTKVAAIADPQFDGSKDYGTVGAETYGRRCAVCHGVNGVAAGQAPDLRASPTILDSGIFAMIVREGVLVPAGMPRFEELTDMELEATRQFLRERAAVQRGEVADSASGGFGETGG